MKERKVEVSVCLSEFKLLRRVSRHSNLGQESGRAASCPGPETHYPSFGVASGCLLAFLDSDCDEKFLTAM